MGTDQLYLQLCMTFAVSSFSICPLPIGNSSWQLGMAFEIQFRGACVNVIFVRGVFTMDISSFTN